jgi:hypothetical protein
MSYVISYHALWNVTLSCHIILIFPYTVIMCASTHIVVKIGSMNLIKKSFNLDGEKLAYLCLETRWVCYCCPKRIAFFGSINGRIDHRCMSETGAIYICPFPRTSPSSYVTENSKPYGNHGNYSMWQHSSRGSSVEWASDPLIFNKLVLRTIVALFF